MSTIEELAERASQVFNSHDLGRLREITHPDAEAVAPGGMTFSGREAVIAFNATWWEAFPDARIETVRRTVSGNLAVEEGVFRGTHTGVFRTPMGDIPPTGRSVEGDYVSVDEYEGGLFRRQRLLFDRLQLLEQLGLVPEPAPVR